MRIPCNEKQEVIFAVSHTGSVSILDVKPVEIFQECCDLFEGWEFDIPPGVYKSSYSIEHFSCPMEGDYDAQVTFGNEDTVALWDLNMDDEEKVE